MVKLFVEGGGDSNALRTKCREGFNSFLHKAGFSGHMPRIVACGSRTKAFEDYSVAINNGEKAILLIDSETAIINGATHSADLENWKPWLHLQTRKEDEWIRPSNSDELDCHLMVELMETWFLADIQALKEYYGKNFKENSLPKHSSIENISKKDVLDGLQKATSDTQKRAYNKGAHSFEILAQIDPEKVIKQSKWAERFIKALDKKMR